MYEGMTADEVRAAMRADMGPMKPEPREVTLRRLERWAKEIGLTTQPVPKEYEEPPKD